MPRRRSYKKNCYRISVINGDTFVSILTKILNINQQIKYKPGTNMRYFNCVLTEVDNPRGVAGTQWNSFIEDICRPKQKRLLKLVFRLMLRPVTMHQVPLLFGMQLVSNLSMPKYVYSLTCEIDDKYIDIFKSIDGHSIPLKGFRFNSGLLFISSRFK